MFASVFSAPDMSYDSENIGRKREKEKKRERKEREGGKGRKERKKRKEKKEVSFKKGHGWKAWRWNFDLDKVE